MDPSAHDARETYCRMLGHEIQFKYCRSVNDGMPCRRIADCWHTRFDVPTWLREHYSPEQIDRITAPPPAKVASILELIERAKAAQAGANENHDGQQEAGR
jgi:hypothetical protein